MINAIDIAHWREEFEQYAKAHHFDLEKDASKTYKNITVQMMWDAYLAGCINMMNLVLERTRVGLVP